MLPKAYLQSLDTALFDPIKHRGGNLRSVINESFAKAMIYSVFYEVVLSPNQVLDLALLRQSNLDPTKDPEAYPFTYSVDARFFGKPNPFTSNLLLILKRGGKDSFVFSSLKNNWQLKVNWGEFIKEGNDRLSDSDILAEARKTAYGEIVEWAEKLDKESNKLTVESYGSTQGIKYQDVFRSFLNETQYLGWLPNLPTSRSEAYALIDETIKDPTVKALAKQIPDFVSNTQYAKGVDSRLSIESSSIIDVDADASDVLRLDLDGLFTKYEFTLDALEGASYTDLSKARKKANKFMTQGWSLENDDPDKAIKLFSKGLKEFFGEVVGKKYTETIMSVGVSAPIANFAVNVPASYIAKLKLKGLDKFINFKKKKES